jgi:ribosome-interacting GTPase 1
MPTNLPPEYYDIEKQFRAATEPSEKITLIEDMLSVIPKHKGTDKLRADLRRKLSKLKSAAQTRKGVSRQDSPFYIDREGAGQVVIVGMANVGKSALVATLTNATPEVAPYPFTTWKPTPGMMEFENIQIQLIDTPPLNRDYVEPEMVELIKRADLILVMVNLQTDPLKQLEDTITFLLERRIVPLRLAGRYEEDRRATYKPVLVLVNKCDDESADEDLEIFCALLEEDWPLLAISATTGRNLDRFKRRVFEELDIIRVVSKAPGREPDYGTPFVLDRGTSVEEFAEKVHQDFARKMKLARVWGSGVHEGQAVGRDHELQDGDVVELHM